MLHNPAYDFEDASLTAGVAMWARLVEEFLPRDQHKVVPGCPLLHGPKLCLRLRWVRPR